MNIQNNELKEYYDQHYNKDGQGPPFEQLAKNKLDEIADTVLFRCFLMAKITRKIQREINEQLIKQIQNERHNIV